MAKVAFLGLGVMGFPMAGHLVKAGHEVTVYNRTAKKSDEWVAKHKGKKAATPAEAAKGQEIVFCCVGNDNDLRSVIYGDTGAFAGMAKGAVFVEELDDKSSPMKAKGVAELGICGAGAAIANAVYNATGIRLRDYPLTLDKLIDRLPPLP